MSRAWIYQKNLKTLGADKAPYYVGWREPSGRRKGRSCGVGFHGKKNAEQLRIKIEAELTTGKYKEDSRMLWDGFRQEYETRIMAGKSPRTRAQAKTSLDHFERIAKPYRVFAITTKQIDEFIAKRRQEGGLKPGSVISPASVNADLRNIKAALRVAKEWHHIDEVPRFRMEKVIKKVPTYVTGEHFSAMYKACETARMPEGVPNVSPADWWRALLVFGYMTGWRIGDMLALRRDRVNMETGAAVSMGEDNKGKRDDLFHLHPVVLEHLRKLEGSFDRYVFPWNHDQRTLYVEFGRIQRAAGINLPCKVRGQHECTPHCHVYGFHDLRRAFATMNADKLTGDALQALMRHKSYQTTQVYINMARQIHPAVASLHVPAVLVAT
jgi:integrase